MFRLRATDIQFLRDVEDRLQSYKEGESSALIELGSMLAERFKSAMHYAYGIRVEQVVDLDYLYMHGAVSDLPSRFRDLVTVTAEKSLGRWGAFDPRRPEPEQRNRTLTMPEMRIAACGLYPPVIALARSYGFNNTLRILVCDGPVLLSNIGFFWYESTGVPRRYKQLLEMLVPLIRRRLLVERMLGDVPIWLATLDTALAQIASPALIAGPHGAVLHANAAGREFLDKEGSALIDEIVDAVRGIPTRFRVVRIDASGCPPHYLLVAKPISSLSSKVSAAASRWKLSPRQTEVLRLLADGKANKTIAAILGCAESTVELHVTAILDRAQLETRAEVIVAVWRMH